MKQPDENADPARSGDEIQKFPLRRLYFLVISFLTLLSPLGLSLETEDLRSAPWKFSANIQITSITLIFLLLIWLPFLIPWLVSISPRFQRLFTGLREGGVEEIEAGIIRIKLSPGLQEAAETYKTKVADLDQPKAIEQNPDVLERSYRESLNAINNAEAISSREAMSKIIQLSKYYDEIRTTMPSSSRRTRLMQEVSAIIWSLMPSIENLPVREWLKSARGGERLVAYKYLEYKLSLEHLDLLLSRAVGILEEPYGQYSALLALRRLIINLQLDTAQRELITNHLTWAAALEYMGKDRVNLMKAIHSILGKSEI